MDPAALVELVNGGMVGLVAWRLIPLLRTIVRLTIDIRRRVIVLERAFAKESADDESDQPDELLEHAGRALGP